MKRGCFPLIILCLFVFVFLQAISFAEIYKYKDQNGNWVFTDTPPEEKPLNTLETVDGVIESGHGIKDIKARLEKKYHPSSGPGKASLATVMIKTPMGSGSGFFITQNGYILTNRHVIRGDDKQIENTAKQIEQVDSALKMIDAQADGEASRIKEMESQLETLREKCDLAENDRKKEMICREYKEKMRYFKARKKYYDTRRSAYESKKKEYRDRKWNYQSKTTMTRATRNFTIIFKDGIEKSAYLIRTSDKLDLALLKIDGCRVPFLEPAPKGSVHQGMPVYAIGSPIGMRDSMSRGIVSGFRGEYVKTDAKIYPGNSGGPLVNRKGRVVGLNTMKQISHGYEGLGFAIDIQNAVEEFGSVLYR